MSPRDAWHAAEWIAGSMAAGALMLGATGGVVTKIVAATTKAASSIVALIGLAGTALTGIVTVLVARINAAGKRREVILDRIESAQRASEIKADDRHAEHMTAMAAMGERVAALEALRSIADERGHRLTKVEQDLARVQGHLRRD